METLQQIDDPVVGEGWVIRATVGGDPLILPIPDTPDPKKVALLISTKLGVGTEVWKSGTRQWVI